jgi:hypothetical protein
VSRPSGDHVAAAAWFGEPLARGDWVNATWINPIGKGELRMIDIIGADARHRVLIRSKPEGVTEHWEGLDYDDVQAIADRVRHMAIANGAPLWEFAGPMASLPTHLQES